MGEEAYGEPWRIGQSSRDIASHDIGVVFPHRAALRTPAFETVEMSTTGSGRAFSVCAAIVA